MAVSIEETDDPEVNQAIVTSSVRLSFQWVEDRWVHALGWPSTAAAVPLVQSIDRHDEQDVPLSPAFQQLHMQPLGACQLAGLVGQACHHHYSAAFTVHEQPGAIVQIEADVADRRMKANEPAVPLVSTFELALGAGQILEAGNNHVRWDCPGLNGKLSLESLENEANLSVCELGPGRTHVQITVPPDPSNPTRRLVYRWTWVPTEH